MPDEPLLSGGPEEIKRKLRAIADEAKAKSERFTAVRRQVETSVIDEESPDGVVRVSVRASGALAGLHLSERARGLAPAQLAELVMATVARAQGKIAARVQQIARDNGVGEDPATTTMVARFTEEFPEPEPSGPPAGPGEMRLGGIEDEPAPKPSRPATPPDEDDGYWDKQSFLRGN
ncbi:YbaB/EbfC family nucleoid-associated protein [Amycolatopsis acidicola]|uniref:YbaB/EbfC family nucleoid-associated protein n=1 Tax=Amycolatopsis acidicola TaxID=2596893 RepID=A0A5N0UYI0_9PSEU|nr:YbaB/EbfC family nucleoid-associated protein [Amycolatopsis acidicola]KAA9157924.1 YbaB/EbfC family nucleoid-associated protein [Amycolatopsis acidicola]